MWRPMHWWGTHKYSLTLPAVMKIGFVTKHKQALVYYHHQKSPTNNKKNKKLGGPRFRTILRAIYTSLKNLTHYKT